MEILCQEQVNKTVKYVEEKWLEDELKGKIQVVKSQIKEIETIETAIMKETTKKTKPRHKWEEISKNRWRCSKCGCKKIKSAVLILNISQNMDKSAGIHRNV